MDGWEALKLCQMIGMSMAISLINILLFTTTETDVKVMCVITIIILVGGLIGFVKTNIYDAMPIIH